MSNPMKVFPIPAQAMALAKAFHDEYTRAIEYEKDLRQKFRDDLLKNSEDTRANLRVLWSRLAASVGLAPETFDNGDYGIETRFVEYGFAAIFHDVQMSPQEEVARALGVELPEQEGDAGDPLTEGAPDKSRLN